MFFVHVVTVGTFHIVVSCVLQLIVPIFFTVILQNKYLDLRFNLTMHADVGISFSFFLFMQLYVASVIFYYILKDNAYDFTCKRGLWGLEPPPFAPWYPKSALFRTFIELFKVWLATTLPFLQLLVPIYDRSYAQCCVYKS